LAVQFMNNIGVIQLLQQFARLTQQLIQVPYTIPVLQIIFFSLTNST